MHLHPAIRAWEPVIGCLTVLVVLAKQSEGIIDKEIYCSCKQDTRTLYSEVSDSDTVVSYGHLKEMLVSGSVQLFDVRNPDEFEEGSIPGATNIPLGDLEEAFMLTPDQFIQQYGVSLPGKGDCDIIMHCQRGHRSLTALEILQALGYCRARHYAGGYSEWAQLEE